LPKINAFKQYYVLRTVTGTIVFLALAHDDIVHCGKGVRTQEIKIGLVLLWWFYFSTKILK